MSDGLVGALLVVAFLAASGLAEVGKGRWGWMPMALLCAISFLGALELARFDHGRGELLFLGGYVAAPVAAILGGASWGTRTFYGWPDLGPIPSRLGLWAGVILVGVLLGTRVREDDVRVSQERGAALRTQLTMWKEAHGGAWPATLEAALPNPESSRMGLLSPPPFTLAQNAEGKPVLRFPLSGTSTLDLGLDDGVWKQNPPPGAGARR